MKTILLLATFLLAGGSFAQVMMGNKVNVFTLLVDYDNPQFEGGNLAYYDCADCSNDSLPFVVDYKSPGDFGSISFTLSPSGDTLFYGSMIWMGQGQMFHPSAFRTSSPFVVQEDIIGMPEDVICYDMSGHRISDPQFVNSAQSAWYEVNRLEAVKLASENNFKTAMFMYAPSVGGPNPTDAKWIIFLYRNIQLSTLTEMASGGGFTVYPNPAKSLINVSESIEPVSHYEVRNNLGQVLQTGKLDSRTILLTGMSEGMYFLDLRDGDNLVQRIRFQKF
jgi:hypothetical protein